MFNPPINFYSLVNPNPQARDLRTQYNMSDYFKQAQQKMYDRTVGGIDAQLNRMGNAQLPPANQPLNWGAAVTGGLQVVGDTIGMSQQSLNLGDQPGLQYSATGEPILNSSFRNTAMAAKPEGATGGELLSGVASGAAAGMVAAGPVGAAIGGLIGAAGKLIGGGARARRQRRERQQALKQASAYQKDFNAQNQQFEQNQVARDLYNQRMDMTNRMYNLYTA